MTAAAPALAVAAAHCPIGARRLDVVLQGLQIFSDETAVVPAQLGDPRGAALQPEIANELGVDLDALIRADEQRTRRSEGKQGSVGSGSAKHLLGKAEPPRGDKGDGTRER